MNAAASYGSMIIRPSAFKLLSTLGLGGMGMTAGSALLVSALFGRQLLWSTGWIVVALMGALSAGMLLTAFLRGRPRIEISPVGLTVYALFGSYSRRWSEIEGDFVAIKLGFGQAVGYNLTAAHKESSKFKPATFAGNDAAISGAYAVPMNQLAIVLNEFKAHATR